MFIFFFSHFCTCLLRSISKHRLGWSNSKTVFTHCLVKGYGSELPVLFITYRFIYLSYSLTVLSWSVDLECIPGTLSMKHEFTPESRGVRSYPQRSDVGAGFHCNQTGNCVISGSWLSFRFRYGFCLIGVKTCIPGLGVLQCNQTPTGVFKDGSKTEKPT